MQLLCEYSNNEVQTINPGETVIFDTVEVPCSCGRVRHRDGTGVFLLSGGPARRTCPCRPSTRNYTVDFSANIAIPTGGTVGEIEVALAVDGSTIPSSQMIVTPAAVEEFGNVSVEKVVDIFTGCCQTFSVRNVSDQPIVMQNANIVIKG